MGMVSVAKKEKDYDRALFLLKKQKELIELFHLEDIMMLQHYQHAISIYSDMKIVDKTLDAMEQYVNYIDTFSWDNYDISKNEFFNKNKSGLHIWRSSGMMKVDLMEELKQNPRYEFVRNTERYNIIIQSANDLK